MGLLPLAEGALERMLLTFPLAFLLPFVVEEVSSIPLRRIVAVAPGLRAADIGIGTFAAALLSPSG